MLEKRKQLQEESQSQALCAAEPLGCGLMDSRRSGVSFPIDAEFLFLTSM